MWKQQLTLPLYSPAGKDIHEGGLPRATAPCGGAERAQRDGTGFVTAVTIRPPRQARAHGKRARPRA